MATYNLINSVKGGCGKTAFSIWLAYYLEDSLLIDMDLLGTSMQITFDGNADIYKKIAYTNDIFKGVKNNHKDFVERVELATGECINVILANMDHSEKGNFKSGRHSGYTPAVKHSIFRMGLRELIKKNRMVDGKSIKHFIFDMPPNSDGFSDAAMECVFNPKYSDLNAGDRKNLFMMIGVDLGQTIATIQELKFLLLHSDEREADRIFLVINHNLGKDFGDNNYKGRKDVIQSALRGWKLDEKITEKIFFLKIDQNEEYTKLGIAGLGLRDAKEDVIINAFPSAVISAFAEYGEEFKEIASIQNGQHKLKELITGEEDEDNGKAQP